MDAKEREWKGNPQPICLHTCTNFPAETKRILKEIDAYVLPKPPKSPEFMRKVHQIIFNKKFEIFMTILVCLNMIVFMLEHRNMDDQWTYTICIFRLRSR